MIRLGRKCLKPINIFKVDTSENGLIRSSMSDLSNLNTSIIASSPLGTNTFNQRGEKYKEFVYDSSYWSFDSNDPEFVSQRDVYNDLGKTTVGNAFDGYNACICAYGQTGSGKSYSMMGQTNHNEQEGLTPRICKVIKLLNWIMYRFGRKIRCGNQF